MCVQRAGIPFRLSETFWSSFWRQDESRDKRRVDATWRAKEHKKNIVGNALVLKEIYECDVCYLHDALLLIQIVIHCVSLSSVLLSCPGRKIESLEYYEESNHSLAHISHLNPSPEYQSFVISINLTQHARKASPKRKHFYVLCEGVDQYQQNLFQESTKWTEQEEKKTFSFVSLTLKIVSWLFFVGDWIIRHCLVNVFSQLAHH